MTPRKGPLSLVALLGGDALALSAAYFMAIQLRVSLNEFFELRFTSEESLLLMPPFLFMLLMSLFAFLSVGLYSQVKQDSNLEVLGRVIWGCILGVILILSSTFFLSRTLYSRSLMGTLLVSNILAVAFVRLGARWGMALVRRRGLGVEKTAIVGEGDRVEEIAERLDFPGSEIKVEGIITVSGNTAEQNGRVLGGIEQLEKLINEYNLQRLLLSDGALSQPDITRIARICEKMGVYFDRTVDVVGSGPARLSVINGVPLLSLVAAEKSRADRLTKRAYDFLLSLLALSALSPLFLVMAAAIRIESPGPVFFYQRRRGKGGRHFDMLKFRSMRVEAETERVELSALNESDGALFKIRGDPRITRVGRIMRRFSVDELPQLVNVLRGQMSFVGPRPLPIGDIEERLEDPDPSFQYWIEKRESVLPGITGLWQVRGRSELGFREMLALDMFYVKNFSFLLDLQILARTVPVVLTGKGAY